ncbi:MAG TPA: DUF3093 domain-containing protein [Mycobacteriales bacterium]|nr:DUF3093 domain-containing protein [Mycobacteriales bacterium]
MSAPAYVERLTVPGWYWPAGVALAALLAAPVHGGAGGVRAWLPYVVAVVVAVVVLRRASRGEVRVQDGVLHVPGARAPLSVVGGVRVLEAEGTRRLRGPLADVRAHVATRSWLRRSVQVRIDDPADDTPYWLVGTRRPEQLAAVLEAALTPGGRAPSS